MIIKNKSHHFFKYILICLLITNLYSHSRVAFSRPGMFVRTPSSFIQKSNSYFIGLSTEIINTNNNIFSKSIHFTANSINGFQYGLSYSQRARTTNLLTAPSPEVSFHFNKEIYNNDNFIINVGAQDIIYHSKEENQISAFISLINKNIDLGYQYKLQSALGFGTGKINADSYSNDTGIAKSPDFFVGIKISTPIFQKLGGLTLLADYDGEGVNIAASIFPSKNIILKLGITHFENIIKFNTLENIANETIYDNSPGLSIGLDFKIPTNENSLSSIQKSDIPCYLSVDEKNRHSPLSLNVECNDELLKHLASNINYAFESLHDSLLMLSQDFILEQKMNMSLSNQTKILQDSIYMQYLNQRILQSEINIAMKHLSNSLQHYYLEDYRYALEEADLATLYLPDLAYIYARKGSIYYKLGDINQATINWNIALKLDPEYIEVRQMLANIKINDVNLDILSN